ncbi:MAG TPA: hypothetical protein VFV66_26020 [Nonomuraea sp.]|nr:hypothetical protein [Nonomuraea sp.]
MNLVLTVEQEELCTSVNATIPAVKGHAGRVRRVRGGGRDAGVMRV